LHDVADDDDVDEVVPEEEAVSGSDDVRERCLDVDAECSAYVEIGADVDEPIAFLPADEDRPCSSGVQSTQPAESSQVLADYSQLKDAVAGIDENLYSYIFYTFRWAYPAKICPIFIFRNQLVMDGAEMTLELGKLYHLTCYCDMNICCEVLRFVIGCLVGVCNPCMSASLSNSVDCFL